MVLFFRLFLARDSIEKFLNTGKRDQRLQNFYGLEELSEIEEIRVTCSILEGNRFVNIRVWNKKENKCYKQGITLARSGWSYVKCFFHTFPEAAIAQEAYQIVLEKDAHSVHVKACNGCLINHPSQHQHSCLEDKDPDITLDDLKAVDNHIKPCEVIAEMAAIAQKKGIILQRPFEYFQLCKYVHLDKILRDCVKSMCPHSTLV